MKKFNFFLMLFVATVAMGASFTSCGNDDDDSNSLVGTVWVYHKGSTHDEKLTFSDAKKVLLTIIYSDGHSTTTTPINYTYKRTGNLIIFTPENSEYAILEGEITENTKMVVTNGGTEIGIFYKQ